MSSNAPPEAGSTLALLPISSMAGPRNESGDVKVVNCYSVRAILSSQHTTHRKVGFAPEVKAGRVSNPASQSAGSA